MFPFDDIMVKSHFFEDSYDWFTLILQGGFTGTGAAIKYFCPSANEVTLMNIGKLPVSNRHKLHKISKFEFLAKFSNL